MLIKPLATNYQRNGVCGDGFWTVRFLHDDGYGEREFIAVMPGRVLEEDGPGFAKDFDGECYVICVEQPETCWRGDRFADAVREAINDHEYRKPYIDEVRVEIT